MCRLIIVLFLAVSVTVYSQEPSYKQYSVKDGLPSNTVYQSVQDKNGYIWFATNQGVSRFDGNSFKNFYKEDGLPDNDIIKLYVDSHNNIWFISMIGIASVYINGKIVSMPQCENVNAIAEDLQSNKIYLIAASFNVFGYYESMNAPEQWAFTAKFMVKGSDRAYNTPVLRYSNSNTKIFFSHDFHSLTCSILKNNSRADYTYKSKVENIVLPFGKPAFFTVNHESNAVVFHTMDSLYLCTEQKNIPITSLEALHLNETRQRDISSLFYENDNRLWIATRNHGLICITDFLTPSKKVEYYFQKNFCSSITKDREGGFWLTTHNDGVYYIPDLNFRRLLQHPDLMLKDVKVIKSVNQQSIIAGFADGNIAEINAKSYTSKVAGKWIRFNKNNRIMDLYPFKGKVFVATDKGLYQMGADDDFKILEVAPAKSVVVDDENKILTAFAHGVEVRENGNVKDLFEERATCVTATGKKYYWGTLKGLYLYAENSAYDLGSVFPEISGMINHVQVSADSAVWVSTQNGIVILKNNKSYSIRKEHGLSSNTCKHILLDDKTAWVSTNQGLSKIDCDWQQTNPRFEISKITEADGLISNNVNQTAISNNMIWVATSSGISFFPRAFASNSAYEPTLNISKVMVGKREVEVSEIINIKPQQSLSIELSGISYRSGKEVFYEYRFSNLDKKWSMLGSNKIEFTALPFGIFNLEIRAIDRWGNKSQKPVRITVFNKPPIWRTSWFQAICYALTTMLIALLAYTYFRRRQRLKEKEFYEKKKMLELEMMALRAQINPHFIFNCLSSIQHHILSSDPVTANLHLHKLSTLIRKTLQSSSSPTISLAEEISIIKIFMELQKLRLEERLDYALIYPPDLANSNINIPSMIIQPFVENAVKHGISPLRDKKGFIEIEFSRLNDRINCRIEDNGIGINASKQMHKQDQYASMGSSITEGRIQAINGLQDDQIILQITDKKELTGREEGTIVNITFVVKSQL